MKYYIYMIQIKINYKVYIGQTHNPKTRWRLHQSSSKRPKHKLYNQHLYAAARKYGWNNFEFSIIEEYDILDEVNEAEEFWISYLNTMDQKVGYNLQGGGYAKRHTEDSKRKIGAAQAGEKAEMQN